jgi:adenosylcobinamide-phosphate synthase
MTHAQLLLAILIVEAAIGYPNWLYQRIAHPVSWVGNLIARLETAFNKGPKQIQKLFGIILMLMLGFLVGSLGWLIENTFHAAIIILIGTTGLAQKSLYRHAHEVLIHLQAKDLAAAKIAVGKIVGRDTNNMQECDVTCAAIETVAESFNDGIVAPAFWFFLAGLPGLFIYKVVNTADSMIGHMDARYQHFGWAAARIDDAMNFLPARLSGLIICVSGAGGFRTMIADAPHHASPNAGWPEAAMASVLNIQLGGAVSYEGEAYHRPYFGKGTISGANDLVRALNMLQRTCLMLWLLVAALAWSGL